MRQKMAPLTTYEKTDRHNTNYYRRNKVERFCVLSCPMCSYETTGPKSSLKAHIWSKHTAEDKKPFQCPCHTCNRGFAARANLIKHVRKEHNIILPKKSDKNILVYDIIITDNALNINNKRFDYYKKNRFIPVNCIGRDKQITRDDIYFDVASKNISMKSYTREELLKIWFQKQNNIKN
tara:strand:+ start:195 stop:731 length:537 start_codon:yes stop_codon:yes gene_type:complete